MKTSWLIERFISSFIFSLIISIIILNRIENYIVDSTYKSREIKEDSLKVYYILDGSRTINYSKFNSFKYLKHVKIGDKDYFFYSDQNERVGYNILYGDSLLYEQDHKNSLLWFIVFSRKTNFSFRIEGFVVILVVLYFLDLKLYLLSNKNHFLYFIILIFLILFFVSSWV